MCVVCGVCVCVCVCVGGGVCGVFLHTCKLYVHVCMSIGTIVHTYMHTCCKCVSEIMVSYPAVNHVHSSQLSLPLQVDVLESQFTLLLQNITSTLDFESIKLAHEHFVSTLQGQLFLLMPPVSRDQSIM